MLSCTTRYQLENQVLVLIMVQNILNILLDLVANYRLGFRIATKLTYHSSILFALTLSLRTFSSLPIIVQGRRATAGKLGKIWSLPRFLVSIHSYEKNRSKKFGVQYWTLPGSNFPWRSCCCQFVMYLKLWPK